MTAGASENQQFPLLSTSNSPSVPAVARHRRSHSQTEVLAKQAVISARLSTATTPPAGNSSTEPLRPRRKLAPALLARLQLFDKTNLTGNSLGYNKDVEVGRIPEEHLRVLDSNHKDLSIRVTRRGRAYTGPQFLPSDRILEEEETDMAGEPQPGCESNRSSIITTSERIVATDSEHSDVPEDNQKYVLPDISKTIGLYERAQDQNLSSATASGSASTNPSEEALNAAQEPETPLPALMDSSGQSSQPISTSQAQDLARPPTPPPKDSPRQPSSPALSSILPDSQDVEYYPFFSRNRGLSRANSIYSLSRASFTNQIQQLTSINLPNASSLSSSISAIPKSIAAARALNDAANQIREWMYKASEVLSGLDAEDDVEWAAEAGREGLEEVDAAIRRFEGLIEVYIIAIEELQMRSDIASLPPIDLKRLVDQMDELLKEWQAIKQTLKNVKEQVEIAMEWGELWNVVLGEIGVEIEALGRLVFEMEERRHKSALLDISGEGKDKLGIPELENMVKEAPKLSVKLPPASNRFSLPPFSPTSPVSPLTQVAQEDSNLLGLFARMQPLRASLDFLPMRLGGFHIRGKELFPSACDDLDRKKESLEGQWKKLEADADALRREFGEDRWLHVFRTAGGKALTMWTSLTRSISKLYTAIEEGADHETVLSKLGNYEDKKTHYPPAIARVLAIIDRGIKDRLTVNGEILRLQSDIKSKLAHLEEEIKKMDEWIDDMGFNNQQLRDSISTILSTERSVSSSAFDTPGSSPASSVIMSRQSSIQGPSTPHNSRRSRPNSVAGSAKSQSMSTRRFSGVPGGYIPRKTPLSRSSASDAGLSPAPLGTYEARTPTPSRRTSSDNRPRWNSSTNLNGTAIGHNFKPLTLTTPSPHQKLSPPRSLRSVASHSSIPRPSPLGRNSMVSPPPLGGGAAGKRPSLRQMPSTPNRLASNSYMSRNRQVSTPGPSSHRNSTYLDPNDSISPTSRAYESPSAAPRAAPRAASALALGRRTSMLPMTKDRTFSGSGSAAASKPAPGLQVRGESRQGGRKSSAGERPRWR